MYNASAYSLASRVAAAITVSIVASLEHLVAATATPTRIGAFPARMPSR